MHNLTWSERKEKVEKLLEQGRNVEIREHPSFEDTYVVKRGIERDSEIHRAF